MMKRSLVGLGINLDRMSVTIVEVKDTWRISVHLPKEPSPSVTWNVMVICPTIHPKPPRTFEGPGYRRGQGSRRGQVRYTSAPARPRPKPQAAQTDSEAAQDEGNDADVSTNEQNGEQHQTGNVDARIEARKAAIKASRERRKQRVRDALAAAKAGKPEMKEVATQTGDVTEADSATPGTMSDSGEALEAPPQKPPPAPTNETQVRPAAPHKAANAPGNGGFRGGYQGPQGRLDYRGPRQGQQPQQRQQQSTQQQPAGNNIQFGSIVPTRGSAFRGMPRERGGFGRGAGGDRHLYNTNQAPPKYQRRDSGIANEYPNYVPQVW
ncbi:hypothetical protein HDV00_010653 [Rhizophlyctis rosea]|nr:hypothetical protein HDV00_010653 [Rhizophlyctis rosea]